MIWVARLDLAEKQTHVFIFLCHNDPIRFLCFVVYRTMLR